MESIMWLYGLLLIPLLWLLLALGRVCWFLSYDEPFEHHGPLYLARMWCWQLEEFVDVEQNHFVLVRGLILPIVDPFIRSEKSGKRPLGQIFRMMTLYYFFSPIIALEVAMSAMEEEMNLNSEQALRQN